MKVKNFKFIKLRNGLSGTINNASRTGIMLRKGLLGRQSYKHHMLYALRSEQIYHRIVVLNGLSLRDHLDEVSV